MPLPERKLIERIRRAASRPRAAADRSALVRGIGDDCAVLRPPRGHELLVTTDFSIEGVHFRRDWHPADAVGHRCLTRGLSDVAAMGGQPLASFLSLALPAHLPQRWADDFLTGLLRLAKRFGVPLAGGDIAESREGVLADIVVIGSVPAGKAILRSGARRGDCIYVTGALGGSVATLQLLRQGRKLRPSDYPAHFYPTPRLEVARVLREKKIATAMIDLSDGLSVDLAHICEESGVGATVDDDAVPLANVGSRRVGLGDALHGGEDYELLFTAPRSKRVPSSVAGVPISRIGVVTRGSRVMLAESSGRETELLPQGWQHFGATD